MTQNEQDDVKFDDLNEMTEMFIAIDENLETHVEIANVIMARADSIRVNMIDMGFEPSDASCVASTWGENMLISLAKETL